jgi:8-oxo-dGTP pyrophosphatase MutT (NUDIX family)
MTRRPEAKRIRVRTSALIYNAKGEILLLEQLGGNGKPLYLHLPGGGCKYQESYLESLVRELREETGYKISPAHPNPTRLVWVRRARRGPELVFHTHVDLRKGAKKKPQRTRQETKTLGRALWVNPRKHKGPPIKPAELNDPEFLQELLGNQGAIVSDRYPTKA